MRYHTSFLLSAALLVPALLSAQNYRLTQSDRVQGAEVFVNGFPLVLHTSAGTVTANTLAAPYLRQGANSVVVRYAENRPLAATTSPLGRTVLESLPATGEPTRIFSVDRQCDTVSGAFSELWTLSSSSGLSLTQRIAPGDTAFSDVLVSTSAPSVRYLRKNTGGTSLQVDIELPEARLTSLPWLIAGPALDDSGRTQITASVQALHAALSTRDNNSLVAAYGLKNHRLAAAFGQTQASVEDAQRGFYTQLFGTAGFAVTPFAPASLQFTTYPGLNLVKVSGPGTTGAITATGTGLEYSVTAFYSHNGSAWVLVD